MPPLPRVTIALCTYNGAAYLPAQLDSYLAQKHQDWDLWVSDDGSRDGTLEILKRFQASQGSHREVRILSGPGRGFAINYLSLLCHPEFPTTPVALSDQDDVWFDTKLGRALRALANAPELTLYGAQSLHTDPDLRTLGRSLAAGRQLRRPPGLCNALVQNVVSGHSATLSPAALSLVRRAGVPAAVPYHDWWLYQLISGAGGAVRVDPTPVLYYRQHGSNAMGAHQSLAAQMTRLGQAFGTTYGDWIRANLRALDQVGDLLTPTNRALVAALRQPARAGLQRPLQLYRQGIYRQSRVTTLALYLAAAGGRI